MNRDFKGVWIPRIVWESKILTWGEKVLFLEIDSLAKNGECFASNEHFAQFLSVTTRQIQNILASLKAKGFIKIQLFYKGNTKIVTKRIITPVFLFTDEIIDSQSDEEVFAHMDEEVCVQMDEEVFTRTGEDMFVDSNTLFINNTNNNTKSNTKNSFESEFETLWRLYPKKQGKANAKKSYLAARKGNKHSYETIENGLYRYIDYLKVQGTEEKFIMHGSTWFTGQKWLDEYISIAPQKKIKNFYDYYQSEFGGDRNEFARDSQVINYDSIPISKPNEKFGGF